MSTENIGTLATPEDALIGSLERYLYGGQSIQTTTLVGILQLLKEQREANTELNRQVSALQTSQDNIINGLGIKGDGPYSKLVIEYVLGLVAENVALKDAFKPSDIPSELTDVFGDTAVIAHDSAGDNQGHSVSWSWVGNQEDVIKAVLSAVSSRCETPTTKAAISEIGARAVDAELGRTPDAEIKWDGTNLTVQNVRDGFSFGVTPVFVAANLRAGRKG